MRTLSKSIFSALLGTILLASCSRPVAYFQPSAREHFASKQPEVVATPKSEKAINADQEVAVAPVATLTPTEQVAQTKQTMSQVEAYVRNDNALASNKKLTKRIARLNEMLTTVNTKATVSTNSASAQKMTSMQRTLLKKMDKKIKNHVAPDQTKAASNTRMGLIIGVIGLILILVGSIAGSGGIVLLGLIGLIVGLVLLLIGLAGNG